MLVLELAWSVRYHIYSLEQQIRRQGLRVREGREEKSALLLLGFFDFDIPMNLGMGSLSWRQM